MSANDPNEVSFQIWPVKIAARGRVAILLITPALTAILVAVALRIVWGGFGLF